MAENTPPLHGVINLLKPPGMTSHDAVSFVRRTLGTKRVGHTGTLDPAAAGVLPICVGQATRLVEYLQGGTKEYIAEATFGYETDTGDAVGEVVNEGDASAVTLERLRAALDQFRGTITQTPPMHSAIKVGGKKLYELAREGETEVEIPTREVVISQLLATRFVQDPVRPRAMLHIQCSGGTYIRSLVRDIGQILGCGATMTFLVRTRSSAFGIEEAKTLSEIETQKTEALIPFARVVGYCAPMFMQDDNLIQLFAQGKRAVVEISSMTGIDWPLPKGHESRSINGDRLHHANLCGNGYNELWANRLIVTNTTNDIAVIASKTNGEDYYEPEYKPDKVFFLNNND